MGLLGLLRNIFRALLGPLLIYFIIASHVAYQIGFKEPEALSITQWPATTNAEDKQAIIDARKPIIREFMDFLGGKNAEFFKQHATEDIDWEDPIERITGLNEVDGFARLATRLCKNAEIEIFSENHAPHEIVMDWKLTTTVAFFPPLPLSMRTHILLEPSEVKVGAPEKVFRVYEEWGGNALMNEKTFQPAIIGKVHAMLRKFHGSVVVQGIKHGIL